jgi:tetratricopeptide (TPR) repeat protein
MAFILAKMEKDDEARLYYEKALKINPNLTELLYEDELDEFNRVMGKKTTPH